MQLERPSLRGRVSRVGSRVAIVRVAHRGQRSAEHIRIVGVIDHDSILRRQQFARPVEAGGDHG